MLHKIYEVLLNHKTPKPILTFVDNEVGKSCANSNEARETLEGLLVIHFAETIMIRSFIWLG